jgi:hypothetical protein
MKLSLLAALALSATGCASLDAAHQITVPVPMSAVPAGKPGQNAGPSGEVAWADLARPQSPRRATFDDWQVVGPEMKIGRRPDGMWSGTLFGRPVTLSTSLGQISGSGVELAVERNGATTRIGGTVFDAPVRIEVSINRVNGFAGGNAFDLARQGTGQYDGPAGMLTLRGSAATNAASMPQTALALVVALLR